MSLGADRLRVMLGSELCYPGHKQKHPLNGAGQLGYVSVTGLNRTNNTQSEKRKYGAWNTRQVRNNEPVVSGSSGPTSFPLSLSVVLHGINIMFGRSPERGVLWEPFLTGTESVPLRCKQSEPEGAAAAAAHYQATHIPPVRPTRGASQSPSRKQLPSREAGTGRRRAGADCVSHRLIHRRRPYSSESDRVGWEEAAPGRHRAMSAHCLPARRLTAARESTWPADQLMAVPAAAAASRRQSPTGGDGRWTVDGRW